jgi:hypothetical protein
MSRVEERLSQAEKMIWSSEFRAGKGLGNEVNYYVFDYPPQDELTVRDTVKTWQSRNSKGADGFELVVFDLDVYFFVIGLLNSNVFLNIVKIFNSTLNFQIRDICNMPLIRQKEIEVKKIVGDTLSLSCADWDSFETSWDFKRHPLV